MKKILLIKYGEISLRKSNRVIFERQLMNTIRSRLGAHGCDGTYHVIREQGRLLLEDMRGDIDESLIPKLTSIFGLISICVGIMIPFCPIDDLVKSAADFFIHEPLDGQSFRVLTKRSNKQYPVQSNAVSALIGGCILNKIPSLSVSLQNPDITFYVEIRNNIYLYHRSIPCVGGLPYGSSGKGALLLSGGIDSPVAGYLMARRGVALVAIYFHSPPYTSERVLDKVTDLASKLSEYTGQLRLYVVPFTAIQLFLNERVQAEKLTLLLKRSMLRITEQIAFNEKANCLITGDSVGQVASQTIRSLEAVESASTLPILRPLSALDKQQIIDIAQKIHTFDISIRPYDDCCTLFVARHPEIKPKASIIEGIERRLEKLPSLIQEAVEDAVIYDINPEEGSLSNHANVFHG